MKKSLKKIRQGQTLYHVFVTYATYPNISVDILKIFVHSNKVLLLPEPYCIISKYPRDFLQMVINKYPSEAYFSRRKAEKRKKELKRNISPRN